MSAQIYRFPDVSGPRLPHHRYRTDASVETIKDKTMMGVIYIASAAISIVLIGLFGYLIYRVVEMVLGP